jgi:hypothetical protein
MSRPFYLVQRMTAEDTGRPGFDGHFRLDYMGAAEFEWGALPESLKRIRDAGRRITTIETPVAVRGITKTAYVVGAKKAAREQAENLQEWVDGGCRGHEQAYFAEQIDGSADDYQRRTNAWWDIRGDVMFTLDPDIAKRIVKAVRL